MDEDIPKWVAFSSQMVGWEVENCVFWNSQTTRIDLFLTFYEPKMDKSEKEKWFSMHFVCSSTMYLATHHFKTFKQFYHWLWVFWRHFRLKWDKFVFCPRPSMKCQRLDFVIFSGLVYQVASIKLKNKAPSPLNLEI